ncbi:hypothetical protein B5M09_010605 [Aphanomyces astaci]|uniref:Uncharacterized protein n=1 Tax=Aphanomyces astaci TaxID=112090 RepID=A0A3R7Y342_APHAT|nr:hypothetical protein B5M09_010605 [Aphanomyces astaci]
MEHRARSEAVEVVRWDGFVDDMPDLLLDDGRGQRLRGSDDQVFIFPKSNIAGVDEFMGVKVEEFVPLAVIWESDEHGPEELREVTGKYESASFHHYDADVTFSDCILRWRVGVAECVGAEDGLRGEGFSKRLRVLTDVAVERFEVPCAIAGEFGVVGNERVEERNTGEAKAFVPSSKKGIVGQTRVANLGKGALGKDGKSGIEEMGS